jgi:hypothetical protein
MKNINVYKEKFNRLLESELGDVKPLVEAESGGSGDMSSIDWLKTRYPNGFKIPVTITSRGKNTFSNGIDKINPNDPKIKEISELIKNLLATNTGKIDVIINGGASDVGSSQGYDNNVLATRRRDNLINYLRQTFNSKSLNLIPGEIKVGKATIKDSDEVLKQQYVSVEVSVPDSLNTQITGVAGDNTNINRPNYQNNKIPDPFDIKRKYDLKICTTIPKGLESEYIKLVRQFKKQHSLDKMGISKKTI